MSCRAEFMIEPFHEGDPGPHVMAAVEAARALGFDPEMGPFGTAIEGDPAQVLDGLRRVFDASRRAGAVRISVQIDFAD